MLLVRRPLASRIDLRAIGRVRVRPDPADSAQRVFAAQKPGLEFPAGRHHRGREGACFPASFQEGGFEAEGIVVIRIEDHQDGCDVSPVPDALNDGAFDLAGTDHLEPGYPERPGDWISGRPSCDQEAAEEDRHGLRLGMSFNDREDRRADHERAKSLKSSRRWMRSCGFDILTRARRALRSSPGV